MPFDGHIRTEVMAVLTTLAPEVDPAEICDDEPLREQVDLDSMDWLNFLLGIHKRLHVAIAEKDYGSMETLADVVDYVGKHVGSNSSPSQ